jgi:hypothetical protein
VRNRKEVGNEVGFVWIVVGKRMAFEKEFVGE